MNYLYQDVKHGLRVYARRPSLTLIAVMTLALGIGASSVIFGVVNAILLKPLSFRDAQQIVIPWRSVPPGMNLGYNEIPWGNGQFRYMNEKQGVFETLSAFKSDSFNLTGAGEPALIDGLRVTSGFFPTLGVSPALGSTFNTADDQPGKNHEVILGDKLWREKFGADRSIVGRTVDLGGEVYTVIGVMPPGFSFPRANEMPGSFEFPREAQLWVPLVVPITSAPNDPDELAVIARLKKGATTKEAQAQMNAFARDEERRSPQMKGWFDSHVVALKDQVVGDTRRPLQLILAAVGVVLLIACSNIASLLLSLGSARSTEFSTRLALGAPKKRLIRQLLSESILLSFVGGGLGAVAALVGMHYIKAFGPSNIPRLQDATVDFNVILFGAGITVLCGILVGLFPAINVTRSSMIESINKGNQRTASGGGSSTFRNVLVISEIALALVLSISAGLFFRTFANMVKADGGFRPESVLTFEISLPGPQYADKAKVVSTYRNVLTKLQGSSGVAAVGVGETTPLNGAGESTVIRLLDRPPAKPTELPIASYTIASPGYFESIGTPLLQGRTFLDSDGADSVPVTVINRAMARTYWPGENPIGKQIGLGSPKFPPMTVVGIVADIKHLSMREQTGPEMYVPYTQNPWPSMLIMQVALRTKAEPRSIFPSVERDVHSLYPDLPLAKVSTLTEAVDTSLSQMRFALLSVTAFSGLALLLACVGIYGVISFSVAQRTREIGIRMAVGANRTQIFGLIITRGLLLTAAGISIGLLLAFGVSRLTSSFLYGVPSLDFLTYSGMCLLLSLVTLFATTVPALRAMRINPMVAFRYE
jgi:predicted permease